MNPDREAKEAARRKGRAAQREASAHRRAAGALACERLIALPEYRRANRLLWYVSHGHELPTREAIQRELARGRTLFVPYVEDRGLRLWRLLDLAELHPGAFGILEPPPELRGLSDREAPPLGIDFVVVPGVAFDTEGRRVGSGMGFYDRLLASLRPDCVRAGLCYEAQLAEALPSERHDQPVDLVVTERRTLRPGRSRQGRRLNGAVHAGTSHAGRRHR